MQNAPDIALAMPVPDSLSPKSRFAALPDTDVAENLAQVREFIAKKKQEFYDMLAPFQNDEAELAAEALKRIVQNGATQLPHPEYVIELKVTKTREKRIDVLRQLEGLVPEEELGKAIYLTQPKPEWKADLTKLNPIAKRYGGRIAQIIAEGTPESVTKTEIVVKPRESTKLVSEAPMQIPSAA